MYVDGVIRFTMTYLDGSSLGAINSLVAWTDDFCNEN